MAAGTRRLVVMLASAALGVLAIAGAALALPAESPDNTPMVNGPVRAVDQVGANVWVGGNFSEVRRRDGSLVDRVGGLAVFDSATGNYIDVAPNLSGDVMDIDVYGSNVLVGGNFSGPTSTQRDLVMIDGATGALVRWYNAPALKSVLAAPDLGRVYGGGTSLSAFDASGGQRLWTRAKTTVDPSLRSHATAAAYRDLELDADGRTIWAACACDAVDGRPTKALVKLDTDGNLDPSWRLNAAGAPGVGSASFGISVAQANGSLFLAAGGDDFLAEYRKADGLRIWRRDTSGSAQAVEVMGGGLVVGGHFWEIADDPADGCGFRSSNNAATLDPSDPNSPSYPNPDPTRPADRCATRHGLAAYSFSGELDPGWAPMLEGRYNLTWALHPEAATGRLHVGGEFLTVDGVRQTNYARLSS